MCWAHGTAAGPWGPARWPRWGGPARSSFLCLEVGLAGCWSQHSRLLLGTAGTPGFRSSASNPPGLRACRPRSPSPTPVSPEFVPIFAVPSPPCGSFTLFNCRAALLCAVAGLVGWGGCVGTCWGAVTEAASEAASEAWTPPFSPPGAGSWPPSCPPPWSPQWGLGLLPSGPVCQTSTWCREEVAQVLGRPTSDSVGALGLGGHALNSLRPKDSE